MQNTLISILMAQPINILIMAMLDAQSSWYVGLSSGIVSYMLAYWWVDAVAMK